MSMIKIDTGIPIPKVKAGRRPKYPLRSMHVGDSFFTPLDKRKSRALSIGIHGCAKSAGIKGATRSVEENGVSGIRFWRTA